MFAAGLDSTMTSRDQTCDARRIDAGHRKSASWRCCSRACATGGDLEGTVTQCVCTQQVSRPPGVDPGGLFENRWLRQGEETLLKPKTPFPTKGNQTSAILDLRRDTCAGAMRFRGSFWACQLSSTPLAVNVKTNEATNEPFCDVTLSSNPFTFPVSSCSPRPDVDAASTPSSDPKPNQNKSITPSDKRTYPFPLSVPFLSPCCPRLKPNENSICVQNFGKPKSNLQSLFLALGFLLFHTIHAKEGKSFSLSILGIGIGVRRGVCKEVKRLS
jgi:hypothetical protein